MKKLLVFILLLITTAGTVFPCCQVDDCAADQLTSATNEENHVPEGTCSPFFACATCPGFVELAKPIQIQQPMAVKHVHHAKIVSLLLPTYSASLLQPPRAA